jgi:hypothetical protein
VSRVNDLGFHWVFHKTSIHLTMFYFNLI